MLAVSLVALAAQGATKPAVRVETPPSEEARLFEAHCGICHSPKEYATSILEKRGRKPAVLADRTDLRAEAITSIVRSGIGSMPPQTRVDISDADLDRVIAYLTRPRPPLGAAKGKARE
jgi:mono/diheme cytochrome c family protein